MTEHTLVVLRPPGTTNSMRDGVFDIEHPPQKERNRKNSNQQRGNVDDH